MPSVAPEAEKQSASVFRWLVDDIQFTTKTGISNRNLRPSGGQVPGESQLKNMGKFLTAATPKEVEVSRTDTTKLNPEYYETKSAKIVRGGLNTREGTSNKNNYYSFQGKTNNVGFDREITREPKRHLTEKNYGRMCCTVKPISTATTVPSKKLQDYNIIVEQTAQERGGLSTRNFVKDTMAGNK